MSYYKAFFKYFSVRYDMEKVNIIIKILINFNFTHSNSSIIVTVDHTLYCILHNFYAYSRLKGNVIFIIQNYKEESYIMRNSKRTSVKNFSCKNMYKYV